MSRPFPPRSQSASYVRVNGKIRAREVRVIKDDKQLGIFPLNEALNMARQHAVDLVEISPNANPPVCRLVDFGKFRYEQAKRDKESKKHQHATTVKEVQLSPRIDPHDLGIKIMHAIGFLCEDMKVKVALKFRGREMAHTEIGFEVIKDFLEKVAPYGHPDFEPKLIGKGINAMVSPLPRNKRAKSPIKGEENHAPHVPEKPQKEPPANNSHAAAQPHKPKVPVPTEHKPGFTNNPFAKLEAK
ncbi:MAG TPA: translation initiation factor IF-3 [Verrucomicrobiae bacterium]